jgi:hypothetical protein
VGGGIQCEKLFNSIRKTLNAGVPPIAYLHLGSDPDLTGFYQQREEPISKCAAVARSRGYQIFAIQNGGMCLSGLKAHETYKIHGLARNCKDGKGGEWANDVYIFNGKENGCGC